MSTQGARIEHNRQGGEVERNNDAEREAQALQLECAFCKTTTKHYPEDGMFMCRAEPSIRRAGVPCMVRRIKK